MDREGRKQHAWLYSDLHQVFKGDLSDLSSQQRDFVSASALQNCGSKQQVLDGSGSLLRQFVSGS